MAKTWQDLPPERQKQIAQKMGYDNVQTWQEEMKKSDELFTSFVPRKEIHLRDLPISEWYHWANFQARILSAHTTISPEEILKNSGCRDDDIKQAKLLYDTRHERH